MCDCKHTEQDIHTQVTVYKYFKNGTELDAQDYIFIEEAVALCLTEQDVIVRQVKVRCVCGYIWYKQYEVIVAMTLYMMRMVWGHTIDE